MTTATQRKGTGRSAEFADVGGSNNGLALAFADILFTGGLQGIASGTFVDVTGVTITFVLPVAGTVQFFASATALADPFTQGNFLGLGINVNGTDYSGGGTGEQGFNVEGGGILVTSGFTSGDSITLYKVLSLPAGSYTVRLRALGSGALESSVNFPTKLTAVFPVVTGDVAAASPLATQEAVANGGGSFSPASIVFQPFGPVINISLPGTQTVDFAGFGSIAAAVAAGATNEGQLGVRIDGVDYPGTVVSVNLTGGTARSDIEASVVFKSIALGAGPHTAQLVARDVGGGSSTSVETTVDQPAYLRAIYTVPQAVFPSGDVVAESDSASDTTGSTSFVASAATVTINLTSQSMIQARAFTTGVASGGGNDYQAVAIALRIDGVTYTEQRSESFGNSVGPNKNPMAVFKDIVLLPGLHTITLMFRELPNAATASGVIENTHLSVAYKA